MDCKPSTNRVSFIRKASAVFLSLALVSTVLAACSQGSGKDDSKPRVLRVGFMYTDSSNEQWQRQQFTDGYELTHPGVDIEIVGAINAEDQFEQPDPKKKQPDPYEKLKEMLNGKNPVDVVVVQDSSTLERLVRDNMLKQLDPLIQDNEFDIDDFVPAVIDGIKDAGDGNIYALTPTFTSSALFYNKKMFSDAGISPPTDNMQWPDIMALAGRIAKGEGKDRKFGLQLSSWGGDPFNDVQMYAAPLQLMMFDKKGEKMTVDTLQWKKVWTDIAALYKNKISPSQNDRNIDQPIPKPGQQQDYNPFQGDLFINGRVAMTIGGYDYINQLSRAKDYAVKNKNFPSFDWDVVTIPTFPEAPNVGGNIYLTNLMAINSKAQNSDDAWDFIQFNNSKEWAKLRSRSQYEMVARKSYLKPKSGMNYNIGAFYKLKPVPPQDFDMMKLYQDKPNIGQVYQYGQPLLQDVIDGKKSVDQALKEWQTKGDALLQKIKENPNGPLEPIDGGGTMEGVYGKG